HSVLADSARAADALESGALTLEDPAVQFIAQVLQPIIQMQQGFGALSDQEEAIAADLGRAHFDVYGTTTPPDATFSLRIADGFVQGYQYNGTLAPAYTTFYGLYDRYYSHGGPDTPWDLPPRWLSPPSQFDLATPLNFVLTADVIGGNSGSPVINKDLEVVGLIFDGNIESLPGDYIYDTEVNRSVAVDVRGILEALDDIYDADRIVLELTTGRMVATEAEADAVRR
ncbi:MAG TPA: S46 family peptidase, partial [Gemmatimonadota bacterium]|nr:S46 family peptidase [Gemmatimonadota bacterium]